MILFTYEMSEIFEQRVGSTDYLHNFKLTYLHKNLFPAIDTRLDHMTIMLVTNWASREKLPNQITCFTWGSSHLDEIMSIRFI